MGTTAGNIGRKMYSDPEWRRKVSKGNTLERVQIEIICKYCGNKIILETTKRKDGTLKNLNRHFCNTHCSNKYRKVTEETKKKISIGASKSLKKLWKNSAYVKHMLDSNKKFFTSKGELEVREYFIKNFPRDEWTFGGSLSFNKIRLIRDLYSNKLKVCVEYDGIWHFKNINNQLEEKQIKDKALEDWCLDKGYRLIRISEGFYHDKQDSIQQLIDCIYNKTEKIIKLYE